MNWRRTTALWLGLCLVLGLTLNLASCTPQSTSAAEGRLGLKDTRVLERQSDRAGATNLAEVSPPGVIQELRLGLDRLQPQVTILAPQPNALLQDNQVAVQLKVEDLPLFKAAQLDMGPHLHLILDNLPSQAVYDVSQPVLLQDLSPGTHTIRVFAARPWDESFKNEGAYAQVTFHVFTKTDANNPDPKQPLLTYSQPQGNYGAEPILLDFYLTNAPLHLLAQEDPNLRDWQIQVTVNGESFIMDRWQPLYLKGFKPGKNWVQLELLDRQGRPIQNVFNSTVRLITYQPGGQDTLSQLVRGDLKAEAAQAIVDPNYAARAAKSSIPSAPTSAPTLEPSLTPQPTPTPVVPLPPVVQPFPTASPLPTPEAPEIELLPPSPESQASPLPESDQPQPEVQESPSLPKQIQPSNFFSRFRRPQPSPPVVDPSAPAPEVSKSASPESEAIAPPAALETESASTPMLTAPSVAPEQVVSPVPSSTPTPSTQPPTQDQSESDQTRSIAPPARLAPLLNRFRRSAAESVPPAENSRDLAAENMVPSELPAEPEGIVSDPPSAIAPPRQTPVLAPPPATTPLPQAVQANDQEEPAKPPTPDPWESQGS